MQQISILGCGWLGLPLAKALLLEGFMIKGSATTPQKAVMLNDAGIDGHSIMLNADRIIGDLHSFLKGSEILIIDIPPKLRGENAASFTDKIRTLIPHIADSGIKNVIFISSTTVYADDNTVITESTIAVPDTENGKQLLEAEKLLQDTAGFKTTVLRFGGLIGEDRHPVKYLAGKEDIENPDGPINLIHQTDCIGIILKIIEKEAWGETFNAVAPCHPTREDYYTKKATVLGLPALKFSRKKESVGKTVTVVKIEEVLEYFFKEQL